MITQEMIDTAASRLCEEVIRLRRDFHKHPELGFEEKRSSALIAGYLRELGLEVQTGVARTGVVGLLKGARPGRNVMLRADMDALPIREQRESGYRSVNDGVMHACGHDGHMAILLGTAKLLSGMRDSLSGVVKFVFQPGEENLGGAELMIADGVLENPRVDAAFGLHLISILPYGIIASRTGAFMASIDVFTITVLGRAGHSAMPDGSVDALSLGAHVVTNMENYIKTSLGAEHQVIVNLGTFHGGTAPNIVADAVTLTGTVRALDEGVRMSVKALMEEFLQETTKPRGGAYTLDYVQGYPITMNDDTMTRLALETAVKTVGKDNVLEIPPTMASEDMSFYLREVPGCFFFVGAGNADAALNMPHHNPLFDIDERSLELGVRMMSSLAIGFLSP